MHQAHQHAVLVVQQHDRALDQAQAHQCLVEHAARAEDHQPAVALQQQVDQQWQQHRRQEDPSHERRGQARHGVGHRDRQNHCDHRADQRQAQGQHQRLEVIGFQQLGVTGQAEPGPFRAFGAHAHAQYQQARGNQNAEKQHRRREEKPGARGRRNTPSGAHGGGTQRMSQRLVFHSKGSRQWTAADKHKPQGHFAPLWERACSR
ncbi:hypothetical protein D3C79_795550 [compost metagenome]